MKQFKLFCSRVSVSDLSVSALPDTRKLSFKEKMNQDVIPGILRMAKKEKEHLDWLISNNAPKDMIETSQNYLRRFRQTYKEYVKYVNRLS